jgi:hypothetical protein
LLRKREAEIPGLVLGSLEVATPLVKKLAYFEKVSVICHRSSGGVIRAPLLDIDRDGSGSLEFDIDF